jgi:hypothetical protein
MCEKERKQKYLQKLVSSLNKKKMEQINSLYQLLLPAWANFEPLSNNILFEEF